MSFRRILVSFVPVVSAAFTLGLTASEAAPGDPSQVPAGPPPQFVVPAGGTQVSTPAAGGGTVITLRRPDGSVFASRTIDTAGDALETTFYTSASIPYVTADSLLAGRGPKATHRPRSARHLAAAQSSCGADVENFTGNTWTQQVNWYLVSSTIPANVSGNDAVTALRAAHTEWVNNVNWCGISDQSSLNTSYQGTIAPRGISNDGVNIVDWGDTSAYCPGSNNLACTVWWYDGSHHLTDADIRLNTTNGWTWSVNPGPNDYDIQAVAGHEVGHSVGFGHVNDSTNVMYPYINAGDTSNRKLGKGDANEDNSTY